MCRKLLASATMVLCGLMTTASYGQLDGLYEFDGDVDSTWETAANWEQVTDPNGNPISGDPASPPDGVTTANIGQTGVSSSGGANTALDLNVGAASGVGSLTVSGGNLDVGRDIYVGGDTSLAGNLGTMTVTAGSVTAGDDLNIGMTNDVTDVRSSPGVLNLDGGSIFAGDDIKLFDGATLNVTGGTITSGDNWASSGVATITVDGGSLISEDDFRFDGTGTEIDITVNGGSMEVIDKLRLEDASGNSKLTINGGFVRAEEYGVSGGARGLIEINGDGAIEFERNKLSGGEAISLFGDRFITSDPGPRQLEVRIVIVPDFFGETNLEFTRISLLPEPSSALLLGIGSLGLMVRRRRA